jgi:phosphate transport system substrate-binding protein
MKATENLYSTFIATTLIVAGFFITKPQLVSGEAEQKEKKTVNISGTRFFFPLIEKWAKEFEKENPDVDVVVQSGIANKDIEATGTPLVKEAPEKGRYTTVSRFALVPIVNAKNPAWNELQRRGLSRADFEKIYFRTGEQQNSFSYAGGVTVPIRVYARGACASAAFSRHFGKQINDLANLDTKIADDKVLLQNVLNDSLGVAYNNLGFVYDLQTRKQKQGIRVVPVDLNGNGQIDEAENFYDNLDQLIRKLDIGQSDLPPVGKMVFIYKEDKPEVKAFVAWVQSKGQRYNHSLGFLSAQQQSTAKAN